MEPGHTAPLRWPTRAEGSAESAGYSYLDGHSIVDSIAVSVFADIFLELTNSIRQQDPNNYSDTETRCLVYSIVPQL